MRQIMSYSFRPTLLILVEERAAGLKICVVVPAGQDGSILSPVRTTTCLSNGPGFTVNEVSIRVRGVSWSDAEVAGFHRLNFVRSGLFRLRLRNWEGVADPSVAYISGPKDEQRIAHKVGVEDICTTVVLSDELVAELTDGDGVVPTGPFFTSGAVDLAHRVLVTRARSGGDMFELAERVNRLASDLFGQRARFDRREPASSRTRLAEAAREVLDEDPVSLGLVDVARRVGVSPHYLSRVFRRETGQTLTRFRNRLRVRRALDRIEGGENNLARLAADLGFSDHAHLTRTVRDEVGHTPSAVRALLASPGR
jgi:AraC-like DNA-binding protein